jgi:tRNA threonylcarbamoyl adenosine modification protein (Sua5/YciO/YrdC/YwlC family)
MSVSERIEIHPVNPQSRLIAQAAKILRDGGIVAYPTDSGYAIGCCANSHKGIERLYQIKKPIKKFFMALLFQDFSRASEFAVIDNYAFKLIRSRIPGPYTFILPAELRIVRKLDVKRPEIGCRWPDHPVTQALLEALECPLLNTAAKIEEGQEFTDPDDIWNLLRNKVDLFLDIGEVPINPTNIIKVGNGSVEILRGALS